MTFKTDAVLFKLQIPKHQLPKEIAPPIVGHLVSGLITVDPIIVQEVPIHLIKCLFKVKLAKNLFHDRFIAV